jgi:hypothetical protein
MIVPVTGRRRSVCWVEGHRAAEGLQFTDVFADLALGVAAGGVVVRAEVDELGLLVGEQGPADDEDRPVSASVSRPVSDRGLPRARAASTPGRARRRTTRP